MPERLELTLTPKSVALRPGEPAEIDLSARYLFGAPGADLDVTGEVVVAAAETNGVKGLEGFSVGLDDESVESSTAEIEETRDHRRAGPCHLAGPRSRRRGSRARPRRASRCASPRPAVGPWSAA